MEYTNLGLILALRRAQPLQLWPAPYQKGVVRRTAPCI